MALTDPSGKPHEQLPLDEIFINVATYQPLSEYIKAKMIDLLAHDPEVREKIVRIVLERLTLENEKPPDLQ